MRTVSQSRSVAFLSFILFAFAIGLISAGCTLLGMGVGSLADRGSPETTRVAVWEVEKIKVGSRVEVLKMDGTWVRGKLDEVSQPSAAAYAARYEGRRQALLSDQQLPALGSGAQVRDLKGAQTTCDLLGFDGENVLARLPGRKEPSRLPMSTVAELTDAGGTAIAGTDLLALLASGKLPLVWSLTVSTSGDQVQIPTDDVQFVSVLNGKHGALTGALLGAVADAVVLIVVASNSGSSYVPPPTTSGGAQSSCPYAYSHDGTGWVLDAEPFGGAFLEAAQRTDWSRLPHLREADGSYRVRLRDELREVEHLDQVKLLVADHAPGTTVVPDLHGGLYAVATPVAPSAAHDLRGAHLGALLARRDGRHWQGSPVTRDPDNPADLRDGVQLDFPRPVGARQAMLVIEARSTPWAPALVKEVLRLKGRDLDGWYRSASTDLGVQMALDRFAAEAVPTVRVWTGTGWKPLALLAALPTAVLGSQAVPIDLSRLPGEMLRVQIDGIPGTWAMDAASVSFAAAPPTITELSANAARTGQGHDVRRELDGVDRSRHTMQTGDTVELTFAAPPPAHGLERSLFLKSTGYYTILLPAAGEPRTAEFDRLLSQPGAFARFSLELARQQIRIASASAR